MAEKRVIEVVKWRADWAVKFEEEASAIRSAIPESFEAIHHIGSTAVPGLQAKPIIDILLEVSSLEQLDKESGEMEKLGYISCGEFGIPGRRYFLKGLVDRTHHVHAFKSGSTGVIRHLAFRDYLRAHPEVASEYGELKSKAAIKFRFDNDGYCEAKNDFVQATEKAALEWARE